MVYSIVPSEGLGIFMIYFFKFIFLSCKPPRVIKAGQHLNSTNADINK